MELNKKKNETKTPRARVWDISISLNCVVIKYAKNQYCRIRYRGLWEKNELVYWTSGTERRKENFNW